MRSFAAMSVGLCLTATTFATPALAVKARATGHASVTIVKPLHMTEICPLDFKGIMNSDKNAANAPTMSAIYSPHGQQPTTARSNSDPIAWGEYTLSGINNAQIAVSNVRFMPEGAKLDTLTAYYGKKKLKIGDAHTVAVDLKSREHLRMGTHISIKDAKLSGHYQPTFDVALNYE